MVMTTNQGEWSPFSNSPGPRKARNSDDKSGPPYAVSEPVKEASNKPYEVIDAKM
jgi:hypothetical protein